MWPEKYFVGFNILGRICTAFGCIYLQFYNSKALILKFLNS